MGTTEKLLHIKEVIARAFINASDRGMVHGLSFKYESKPVEKEEFRGWVFQVIVAEAGYGERMIQELKYVRPSNIDAKNMEYMVLSEVLGELVFGALHTWYEVAKMLATDTDLQKAIIHETKENNIITH